MNVATCPAVLHLYGSYYPGSDGNTLHPLLVAEGIRSSIAIEELFRRDIGLPPNAFVLRDFRPRSRLSTIAAAALRRLAPAIIEERSRRFYSSVVERVRPGLLHAHWGTIGHLALPISTRFGLPLITTFYGWDASALFRDVTWIKRYRILAARSAALVVLSDIVKERFVRLGCDPAKVMVWDLPISLARVAYARRDTVGPLRVLAAARFVQKKGYPTLLRALARVSDQHGPATLTAVGFGPDIDATRALARDLGIAERVTIVDTRPFDTGPSDFLSFIQPYFDSHHVFAMPSTVGRDGDDEGGPALTMVYAQAAGLPAVCTPFPGHERTIVDGKTGIVVPMDDVDSLAAALRLLSADRDRWDELGLAGSRLARERFDQKRSVERMRQLYVDVMGTAPRDRTTASFSGSSLPEY